jgi:hypothetical protein
MCGVEKPLTEFGVHSQRPDGLAVYCKPCKSAYDSEYRANNKERIRANQRAWYALPENNQRVKDTANAWQKERRPYRREYHRDWRFGLEKGAWDRLFAEQGRCCAICKTTDPGLDKDWPTDHDHSCCPGDKKKKCGKCVRGILCHPCNVSIGFMQDAPERLRAAADYLERTRQRLSN